MGLAGPESGLLYEFNIISQLSDLKVGQKRKRLDRDSTTPSGDDEHSVGSGGEPTMNGKKKKVRYLFPINPNYHVLILWIFC